MSQINITPLSASPVDLLARRLYEAGCRFAFGMPGGEVVALIDALERAGVRFVLTKHENSGGFMAEGVYHRTGAPGVLVTTLGPGAANSVNVVANAEQDRVPLIVLTGCVDADEALTYTHQIMDHEALFRPITKATFRLTAGGADTIADKAVAMALRDRPGPVHIDIPIGVAEGRPAPTPRKRRYRMESPTEPAAGPDLDEARQWLADAKRPLLLVGLDAVNHGAGKIVRHFVENHQVPFIATYKAKGLVPDDHSLSLGGAGLSPLADGHLLPLGRQADLILCAGYDPIEMRVAWREVWDPAQTRVIDIAAAPNTHYMHQASLNFVCHVGRGLEALSAGVEPPERSAWIAGPVAAAKAGLTQAFDASEEWGPAAVIDEVRRLLPPTAIATVDSGAHRILLSQMWKTDEPRTLLQSTGLCTMGCALPLAMGAKLADPTRPAVSFSGDAGLLMVVGELSTAAELRLPVIAVVFVDASLALIEMKQRSRQLPNVGVDFAQPNLAAIGEAFGGFGFTVRSRSDLRNAVEQGMRSLDRFTLIGCVIERRAYDGRI